ncbi:RDD family protein [Microbacterium sp. JZ31]|uniref:RDD family protein n=1 Tax=Microbacterium sp. JZ31 TaxID=1906274 RepID=UPI0019343A9F|nr:RDD family protein [Microbacterium sp. JZ31]
MTTPNPYGAPAPGAYPPPQHGAPAYPSAPAPHAGAAFPAPGLGAHPGPAPVGAPMPGTPASLARRVGAYAIDVAVIAVAVALWIGIGMLLAQALGSAVIVIFAITAWVLAVAWFLVYTAMQGRHGSIGMRLLKLRLVRLDGGAPLGFGGAFLRNIIWSLGAAIIVGYFSVFFDRTGRNQGWHDKVAHAFMRDASGEERAGTSGTASRPASAPGPVSPVVPAYGGGTSAAPVPAPPAAAPAASGTPVFGGPVPPRPPLPPLIPQAASAARPAVAPPAAGPAAAPAPAGDGLIAFVPGITQDPPAPAGSAAPQPAAPVAVDDLDDDTILVRPTPATPEPEPDVEDTRLVSRARPAVLEWDDGTRHTVAERAVFGRNPSAPEGAEAVIVRDETLSLSKTHFEIVVAEADVSVVDHHSTNGVTIVRAGERLTAAPGEAIPLEADDALEIGDRIVTFKGRG